MGKIYQFDKYILFFYSNDHKPIHVHVRLGDSEIKVEFLELHGAISLRIKQVSKSKFSSNQLNEIEQFCREKAISIMSKWEEVFTHGKKARFEKIKAGKKAKKK
jgi:hypothetical protein